MYTHTITKPSHTQPIPEPLCVHYRPWDPLTVDMAALTIDSVFDWID